jgi:hypothetical protein
VYGAGVVCAKLAAGTRSIAAMPNAATNERGRFMTSPESG